MACAAKGSCSATKLRGRNFSADAI
jgi:hypothetical protein